MRALSQVEQSNVSGADYERIEPYNRFFTNEMGIDASYELIMYIEKNHGSVPLMGALPARLVNELSELYYRSVSYEDALWRNMKVGIMGAVGLAAAGGMGYIAGRFHR